MLAEEIIRRSLAEDIGNGDHTTMSTVPKDAFGKMHLMIKQYGVIAGIQVAQQIAQIHDPKLSLSPILNDGDHVSPGDIAFTIEGKVWSLLSVERVMLNFMQRMSGIASYTRKLADIVQDLPVKILDTRKTTPQFRLFEKMAVSIGGGYNHRFGLYDMILIKDNHVDFAGGIISALQYVTSYLEKNQLNLQIEIEVRNMSELEQVLQHGGVHRIMFDNFTPEQMTKAVEKVQKQYETEASGMINEHTIRAYAETGVDFVSIGALTHQIQSMDLSLKAIS